MTAASRRRWRRSLGPDLDGFGFILPAVIFMVCLVVYPFFLAIWFSLSDAVIGEPGQWVGLENFMYLFGMMYEGQDLPWYLKFTGFSWDLSLADDIFLLTLRNTILFATVSVVLKGVFGLGAALLMQRATRMKRFVRGSILVPFVAPTVLTTLGWWLIFDPTYSHINWLLENLWPLNLLGLGPFQWLGNPNLALSSVIMVNFWRGMPFFAVTIFAGLVAIPDQLYEAAETDGASTVRKFWHVTLPLLRPVMAVVILFSTIFTLADFGIVYVLTRGGPMNYTHLFATYSFTVGILNQEIGLGAAISLFLFPILLLVVIMQLKMVRKETGYGV
jgi:multiple sugar transport system permease protein